MSSSLHALYHRISMMTCLKHSLSPLARNTPFTELHLLQYCSTSILFYHSSLCIMSKKTQSNDPVKHLLAGGIAGAIEVSIMYPTEFGMLYQVQLVYVS